MSQGLLYLRPQRLVYVRVTGPYETSIREAWNRLWAWADKHNISAPRGLAYGLARDNPMLVAPENRRYDAAFPIDPMFEERALRDLGLITLPGGTYVRRREKGACEALIAKFAGLHQSFVPPPGLKLDNNRPLVTVYLDNLKHQSDTETRADVCLPVTLESTRARAAA